MSGRIQRTNKGMRLHIGIFGRRNVGKSSLLNAVTRQSVSIVSDTAGTTTDPVEKPMELLPLGPVLFIDTAGIDDIGALGELRVGKTRRILDRTDIGIIVTTAGVWGSFEQGLLDEIRARRTRPIVVINKTDLAPPSDLFLEQLRQHEAPVLATAAGDPQSVLDLREALIAAAPQGFLEQPPILGDLLEPNELALLVIPIDKEAPRGRLILPQVQTIRDLLDHDNTCLIVKEHQVADTLARLERPPRIVVTDSQAFADVAAQVPDSIWMTGFSVLYARLKGDLVTLVRGALAIGSLQPNDRILVAESCSHHPIEDDIGRVKIPRWLEARVGGELDFTWVQGHDFPEDLSPYRLVIHCGACMFNRQAMLTRLAACERAGVPITNYGLTIAYSLGLFARALEPFPEVGSLLPNHAAPLKGAADAALPHATAPHATAPHATAPHATAPHGAGPGESQAGVSADHRASTDHLIPWITATDPAEQKDLKAAANAVRRVMVGEAVHLRGLIEISNHCRCACCYCGLRRTRRDVQRYRMTGTEVLEAVQRARTLGCGTVVLQAGEDPGLTRSFISDLVRRIKAETGLAVTLSLGERSREDLLAWRRAGADRYFMRFETSDAVLFDALHPTPAHGAPAHGTQAHGAQAHGTPTHEGDVSSAAPTVARCVKSLAARTDLLLDLREMGYEIGSGFMVGLPGQTAESLARDLALCKGLDLDMIGIGPYVDERETAEPSGGGAEEARIADDRAGFGRWEGSDHVVGATEDQVCRLIALARIMCPEANIPSTTALSTISRTGRQAGLEWGANVWMPNLTPEPYRSLYCIYPGKPTADVGTGELLGQIRTTLDSMGRHPGSGPGPRVRGSIPRSPAS